MRVIFGLIVVVILIGGAVFLLNQKPKTSTFPSSETIQQEAVKTGYTGPLIAGTTTPYFAFTKEDYEKAKASGKVILLNFYANWCPVCRAELPDVQNAFNDLTTDKAVGFQVNYNDPDTDEDEKALAKEFGVTYQHTKVLLKDGKVISQETAQWTKEEFITAITAAVK